MTKRLRKKKYPLSAFPRSWGGVCPLCRTRIGGPDFTTESRARRQREFQAHFRACALLALKNGDAASVLIHAAYLPTKVVRRAACLNPSYALMHSVSCLPADALAHCAVLYPDLAVGYGAWRLPQRLLEWCAERAPEAFGFESARSARKRLPPELRKHVEAVLALRGLG